MNTTPSPAENTNRPALLLRAQYVKDVSFENPRAPQALFNLREAPQMEVSVNLGGQKLEEQLFEVAIHVNVRAISDNATLFLTDLVYAGLIELQNIPPEAVEQAVFVQGAQLIYPFARRVIADLTRDGGFPPLQLEPIDFVSMYNQRQAAPAA